MVLLGIPLGVGVAAMVEHAKERIQADSYRVGPAVVVQSGRDREENPSVVFLVGEYVDAELLQSIIDNRKIAIQMERPRILTMVSRSEPRNRWLIEWRLYKSSNAGQQNAAEKQRICSVGPSTLSHPL
jgi:hypothetical protein